MSALKDAKTLVAETSQPNPGDSQEYRAAREALLADLSGPHDTLVTDF